MKSEDRARLEGLTFRQTSSDVQAAELTERLVAFNRSHSPLWNENHDARLTALPLHIFVSDEDGRMVAGLTGRTHALRGWLEVSVLWVDEPLRGRGIGRRLMEVAEAEAARRDCRYSRLSTGDHQAPGFYERLGYTLYGLLKDCPPGETAYYFAKIFKTGP